MATTAAGHRMDGPTLLVDVIERARGCVYCTELFVSPQGFLGNRHKLMAAAAER